MTASPARTGCLAGREALGYPSGQGLTSWMTQPPGPGRCPRMSSMPRSSPVTCHPPSCTSMASREVPSRRLASRSGRYRPGVRVTAVTGKVGKAIKVGKAPGFIAITPDGKTVYVTSGAGVTPISVATKKAAPPIAAGDGPGPS